MTGNATWKPLKLALHPDGLPWDARWSEALGDAIWDWRILRKRQDLVVLHTDWMTADATIRLVGSMKDPTDLGMTVGSFGRWRVDIWAGIFDANKGPGVARSVIAHEIGHLLGLGHIPGTIMAEKITSGPIPIGPRIKNMVVELRKQNVVGFIPEVE